MNARTVLCTARNVAAASAVASTLTFATALFSPALAQTSSAAASLAAPFSWLQGQRPYIGLSLGRARGAPECALTSITCDETRPAQLYAGAMVNSFWGAEVGYLQTARMLQGGLEGRSQGLNLSLIGKTRLSSAWGVYGKLGTTYSRTESVLAGASLGGRDQGFGLSYGGGVSYDFTPRLSARLEFESNDFRFGGSRDPVRSTSLGLQYRY
ncbi:MAG: outer membrane beta-barrel protein [Pseudomonadota bacterium]